MVEYLPRSVWNARPPNAGPGNLIASHVDGAVIHWPGTGSTKVIHTKAAVASALRGWQDYHMDTRGWSDIAYQIAVDQEGRAWTLRGMRTKSGANGDAARAAAAVWATAPKNLAADAPAQQEPEVPDPNTDPKLEDQALDPFPAVDEAK